MITININQLIAIVNTILLCYAYIDARKDDFDFRGLLIRKEREKEV